MCPSHLTRGAWIEIFMILSICSVNICRTSHEVRGLKSELHVSPAASDGRTSHEVRGLK